MFYFSSVFLIFQAPIALKSGIESRLAFLGVRANTVNGLIAIDDIVVFDGNCQGMMNNSFFCRAPN